MNDVRKIPAVGWGALAVGIIAFFVSLSTASTTTTNGEITSCSFFDFGKIALGALALVLVVAAWRANSTVHVNRRASKNLMIGLSVVVAALVVWHVLDAIDVVTPMCAV